MTPDTSRHDAYCAFMRRHRSTVWHVCWRFARQRRGNHADRLAHAEDMVQEVWIMLWLKFDQLNPECTERQQRRWLEQLVKSVLIDLYRHESGDALSDATALSDEPDLPEDKTDYSDTLYDLLAALPDDEERLMRMRFEGYDAQEIADAMQLTRDAVYQRISRIMKKLKKIDGTD